MFFSIVIPTYNRASYVVKTIHSLLQQQYDQYEIIVVDDGSTDNTEEVVRQIISERVKYYKKANAERAAARNYGAVLAKGQYINFFDSDDIAYPNHLLEASRAALHLDQPEVFHLGYDVKDPSGNVLRVAKNWSFTINKRIIDGNHLSCNGVFVRKDIALQFPFNEARALSASEDYELWLRLAARFPFHCVSVVTSTVINHEARSVLKINFDGLLSRKQLLVSELEKDGMVMSKYKSQWNLFKSYLNIYIALHLALAHYPRRVAVKFLARAVKLKPDVIFTRRFLSAAKHTLI